MDLIHVVGARPNFIKVAPVWRAIQRQATLHQSLVHTGQHYDVNMSDVFFTDLGMSAPDEYLGVGSGTHAEQTASVMVAFEQVVRGLKPDLVLVYGDVNSTIASALVCAKLGVPVAHVEAGLRSFDRTMPEEINRLLTDQIADLLFTPSPDADENLIKEGVDGARIHRVGNVMIDSLVRLLPASEHSDILRRLGLEKKAYAVLTMHRPSNVDDLKKFNCLLETLIGLSEYLPIVFPVHPRTRAMFDTLTIGPDLGEMRLIEAQGYIDFLRLMSQSLIVLTDSGGIQEETSYLGIPCLTLRPNTERPITVDLGSNVLVGEDMDLLTSTFKEVLSAPVSTSDQEHGSIPLWDGHAAERIVDVLLSWRATN